MPEKKVFQWKISAKKWLKGTFGGLVIFAFLRTTAGRGVGWEEVNQLRTLLEVLIATLYGVFEAVWGIVKFYREQKEPKPDPPKPAQNFTHKDA